MKMKYRSPQRWAVVIEESGNCKCTSDESCRRWEARDIPLIVYIYTIYIQYRNS